MPRTPHPLASVEQIYAPPSRQDGVPAELEGDLRVVGCMLIQEAGVMLSLPQSTMATAQVVFHRFFYVSSMLSFGVNDLSVACLYLATKLNETPVRLRDLINTYMYLQARIRFLLAKPAETSLVELSLAGQWKGDDSDPLWAGFKFDVPSFHSTVFWEWKEAIQYNELQALKRLGFNMAVDLPYSHAINYLQILGLVSEPGLAQLAWSILNDALLTPLYAQQPVHVLAVAAILLATRKKRIAMPEGWYLLFDAVWDDIWPVCGTIQHLWKDWGCEEPDMERENRWRRAWILADSRKAVRKWVAERERGEREESRRTEISASQSREASARA